MDNNGGMLIGVYFHDAPESLQATLNSIMEHVDEPYELVLLADAPSPRMRRALERYPAIACIETSERVGAAACFNRLCAYRKVALYAYIESGTLLGPGCLTRLIEALSEESACGLVGPSTNACWNEQGQDAASLNDGGDVKRTAVRYAEHYADARQTLEPLYSLGAFCFLVTRTLVEAVGVADEAYGPGPCWEMDYNIRAQRAGFDALWVKGAYAQRLPASAERIAAESAYFERSKQIYQQRFCARRTSAGDEPYAEHCRGDDCDNFAVAGRFAIKLLPVVARASELVSTRSEAAAQLPMVSCVMPTRGRPEWLPLAIEQFHKQDYPNKELIIVYDDKDDVAPFVTDECIRYLKSAQDNSIGAKRQLGMQSAKGEFIAHWDDDDWYANNRLSRQIEPLRLGVADISALDNHLYFELNSWRFWSCNREVYARMYYQQVAGGTLVFRRWLFDEGARYLNISLREDAEFLADALRMGARLSRIDGRHLYIYLRHGDNTWRFSEGQEVDPDAWAIAEEPDGIWRERDVYLRLSGGAEDEGEPPMVSCIMPTADRRAFVGRAIRLFLEQNYPKKELIIIDDGDDSIADLIPADKRIRYLREETRKTTGAKRNQACEMASGEVIVHWDDDDWMAPDWLSLQVATLRSRKADICGLKSVNFYDPKNSEAWRYRYDGARPWVCGGTLCYSREFWRRNPFPDITVGEDNAFVWSRTPKILVHHEASDRYIATVHEQNTSPKDTADRRWHVQPVDHVEAILLAHGESIPHRHAG